MTKARVLLCTSGGICATLSLQALLALEDVEVVGLFLSTRTRTPNGSFLADAMRIAQTSGLDYASYLAMGTTIFDSLRLPGVLPTVKSLAKRHRIPIFRSGEINSRKVQSWLAEKDPDILLSSFFNLKLAPETLAIPNRAAVNLHPALLPAYKGVDPVFYYFLNCEPELGVSLHRMAEDFDTGEILARKSMPVNPNRSVFWHNIELFRYGLGLFHDWLRGSAPAADQSNTAVTDRYDSWPSPGQVKSLNHPMCRFSDLWEQAHRPF